MIKEIITDELEEHPAVRAWHQVQSDHSRPECIEVLKRKRKVAVYRLCGIGSDDTAVIATRCREATANLERLIYEELLPNFPVPALRCYGFLKEPDAGFCWLFLEDATGELYSPQLVQHRVLAGRFLGEMHLQNVPASVRTSLPARGPDHYLQLMRSARTVLSRCDSGRFIPGSAQTLRTLGNCEPQLAAALRAVDWSEDD